MSHCQLTHSTSDHLNSNHASVVTARNCFPFRNVRYNWSKSLHGVYLAKNNQTKTIWSAGMLFVDANENMFQVINMKDLHNFRRNYSWKKLRDWTISFCTLCSLNFSCFALVFSALHDLLSGHSSFLLDFRWWKLSMSIPALLLHVYYVEQIQL